MAGSHHGIGAVYIALSAISLVFNGLAIYILTRTRFLRRACSWYILSMAVSDFLMRLVVDTVGAYANFSDQTLGQIPCQLYGFASTVLGLVSISHLAATSLDIWRSVVLQRRASRKQTVYIIAVLWGTAFAWGILPLVGWSSYALQPGFSYCALKWYSRSLNDLSFTLTILILFFFFPILICGFCYSRVFCVVRVTLRDARRRWGQESFTARRTLRCEHKVAKIYLAMTLAFLVAWSPYAITSLYISWTGIQTIPDIARILPPMFAKAYSCYNPVIYYGMSRKFRRGVRRTLGRRDMTFSTIT
ncbi:melanopsin-B-like [Nematostella vectensis]|uniref:melanopsin-B-like n=1 Tax=Nematostella vectensis TaxID=45351 RepID=UPI0020775E03|nr:melanopsin-B-like [Nematostella vectensis]